MNWENIINNSELVYASVPEDKGFITWSLKKTTCNVAFYETFPIENIDRVICNAINNQEGVIAEDRLATILGFNVIDDFDANPKRYADKAEFDIFKAIVKPVLDWGLIEKKIGDDKSTYLQLTKLGQKALCTETKYKFNTGTKILFENFGIKPFDSFENIFFPFHSALGIDSAIESIRQIPYENIYIDDIFGIEETDLIKRHELQSKNKYNIYKSDTTSYFKIESYNVDIRLYKQGSNYYPIIFNNNIICFEATELLNKPENTNTKEEKIEWGLYLKLIKDPNAILDYQTIIPFEDLLEFDSLIKDNRLVWSDELLFQFIAENADANQWYSVSNHCPLEIIKMNIQRYSDKWDWTSISMRIDDDFLIQNAKIFPWNFEAISAKEDISIEVLKTLLLIPELKEQEWDWDNIMPQLDYEFIKANIESIDFELSALTKTNNVDIRNLIALYPERRWDWAYISNEYDLSFILSNILNFETFVNLKNVINRAFISEDDINLFCNSDNFRKVLLFAKNTTLRDYSPNQSKYIWTDKLISLLEKTGYLIWESGRITSGFECNPFVKWSLEFFNQHHLKITTQKGFDFISGQISDTNIIIEYPDFQWNWDIVSANPNLITDLDFLLSVKDKLNFMHLLPNISGSILEVIFENAGILSFLEANEELWFDVTKKSSKEFVLKHIDYNWDWTILTSRFYSTINIDALGNPKWINKWDWKFLTQNLDLNIIAAQLDKYLERWDWIYLTRKLDKEFILDHLLDYNEHWSWEVLLSERFDKQDLLLSTHLVEVATCISIFDNDIRSELWSIITCKFDYNELAELIAQTFNQEIFYWDYAFFYNLPDFQVLSYVEKYPESIDWKYISESKKLNSEFSYNEKLTNEQVWIKYILRQLDNPKYHWNFKNLSKLDSINAYFDFLFKYRDKLDWTFLSANSKFFTKIHKDERKIKSFQKYIDFEILSQKPDAGLSDKVVSKFINVKWDWQALSIYISAKTLGFIIEQKDKPWDWQLLSNRNDIDFDNNAFIELSNKDWDWIAISNRTDIRFSEDLISELKDKPLDWLSVSRNNTFIPNTKTLSLLKGETLDWNAISQNKNLTTDILWDHRDNLEWVYLTKNEIFDLSDSVLLNKYRDYLDWSYISKSKNFKTSLENLKQFKNLLNWESINKRIDQDISEEFLEPFSDVLDWSNVSKSMKIHFTEELIEKYRTKWDWQLLMKNPQVIERLDSVLKNYRAELNCVEFLEKFVEIDKTPYIYHFTHLFHAIDIIKSRKILSRNKAKELGMLKYDAAGSVVERSEKAHPFARFYFRPQTPTQFYNECLGWDSSLQTSWGGSYYGKAYELKLPKCPIPVFFKFNLKEVLMNMADKCSYSTCNMQSDSAMVIKIGMNPNKINTRCLYYNMDEAYSYAKQNCGGTWDHPAPPYFKELMKQYQSDCKHYSQQEFLVEEEFDFSALESFEIICYNEEYANLLKSQIVNDPICKKVTSDSWGIFHRDNRELNINETDTEISISSDYRDNAYLSIQGQGLNDIQVLNPDNIQKETANEIFAYPEIRFTKTDKPIEVHFVDLAIGKREWLIYKN